MKTVVHKFVYMTLLLCPVHLLSAQDIHFSQFFETPLLRNPALAGLFSGDVRLQAVYRTQWQSITVPYQTTSLNGEFKKSVGNGQDFMTIGGQILFDKAGTVMMTSTHIMPAFNYHKSLSAERNMYLSLGFMGGIVQRRLDRSKMTTNNQFDGTGFNPGLSDGESFTNNGFSYFDGSAGMSFNAQLGENTDNNFFAGIAYHHFNKPARISFYTDNAVTLMPKWVYSSGVRLSATEHSYLTFQGDYVKQGPHTQIIAGGMYTQKLDDVDDPRYLIHLGGFLRFKDAFIPMAKLEMRPLTISASYDANISELTAITGGRGGFEMALSYVKYLNNDNSSRDAVRCPKF
jgi:type IX secretion system PorP/SprF family membrane protein